MMITNRHFPYITSIAAASLMVSGAILVILGAVKIEDSDAALYSMLTIGSIAFVIGIVTAFYARKLAKRGKEIYAIEMTQRKQQLERTAIPYQRRFRKLYNSESQHLNYHRRNRNNPFKVKKLYVREIENPQDLRTLQNVLSQWILSANYYVANGRKEGLRLKLAIDDIIKELAVFKSATGVIFTIQNKVMAKLASSSSQFTILLALDEENREQAVCVVERDIGARWRIKHLATAPHNIRSQIFPMNDDIRVEGAPGALIDRVIQFSYSTKREAQPKKGENRAEFLEHNRTAVTLEYYESSKSYYTDHYFQTDESTNQRKEQTKNLILEGEHLRRYLREFAGRASPL